MRFGKTGKRAVALGCAGACIVGWLTGCSIATSSGSEPSAETAMEAAKEMGVGINLGNTFEAFWEDTSNTTSGCMTIGSDTPEDYETCWGAVVTTKEAIDGYRDAGFQTVRIPVYWGNMMEDDGTYTISEDYFQRIDEVVGWCIEDGLYTVINIHHYDEYLIKNHDKEEVLEATSTLWTQIATHYKSYSKYLVFEGFNENLGSQQESDSYTEEELYDYVNEMNQTFVDAVRSTGGKNKERFLIASGYWTNIDMTTDDRFQIPVDSAEDKLMVSVHYIDNAKYWQNQIGNEKWMEYSTQQCELLKAAFTDIGIPVFVGECTSIYEEDHMVANPVYGDSSACLETLLTLATSYGFVPVLWDTNNNFYSRTDCKINSDSDAAVIETIAAALQEA